MTYVITQACVGKKDASCVSACPVDAIHPAPGEDGYDTADQLYVDPTECVDCGACEPQCPHEAIYLDSEVPPRWHGYIDVNSRFFRGESGGSAR